LNLFDIEVILFQLDKQVLVPVVVSIWWLVVYWFNLWRDLAVDTFCKKYKMAGPGLIVFIDESLYQEKRSIIEDTYNLETEF